MRIDILTTFPGMFLGPFQESIIARSVQARLVEIQLYNLRDFTNNRHRKTDDTQFGGGSGMVMNALPIIQCVEHICQQFPSVQQRRVVFLSPQGRPFNQALAKRLSMLKQLILVCGHYKGFDERAIEHLQAESISIGDYVLSGGEIPAIVLTDAVVRLLPGAVGSFDSIEEDSFYEGLLDAPRYTRPRNVRGLKVPEVLLSGNHGEIEEWRFRQSLERTRTRRPDLYQQWIEKHQDDRGAESDPMKSQ